jgi:hypothetical protein
MQIHTYPTLEAIRHLNEVRGKFVQLRWKGEPWLLFASKDQHAFHNQIVAHFMSEQHLPHYWQSPEILNFERPDLQIVGGGKFWLDWQQKQLLLSDNSMVYGRFEEAGLIAAMHACGMPWAGFSIEIR